VNEHDRLRRVVAEREAEKRLGQLAQRVTTTLIGDIALIEQYFGVLWGHGKRDEERTDSELAWLAHWVECRRRLLDHGNDQKRLLEQELRKRHV
jgi:hypothetical protein